MSGWVEDEFAFTPCVMRPTNMEPDEARTKHKEELLKDPRKTNEDTKMSYFRIKGWGNLQHEQPRKNLRIIFLPGPGTELMRTKVKQYAPIWCEYANMGLQFVTSGDAEIRISFDSAKDFDCALGSDALYTPTDKATMNLAFPANEDISDADYQRSILHAFGHVLGLIHEHQSPAARKRLNWNAHATRGYFRDAAGWNNTQINDRVIYSYWSYYLLETSDLDRESIMTYTIPPSLTTDGFFMKPKGTLTTNDKRMAVAWYPTCDQSFNTRQVQIPEAGQWLPAKVKEVVDFRDRDWNDPRKYENVAFGLNYLDFAGGDKLEVSAQLENGIISITDDGGSISMVHSGNWRSSGCAYQFTRRPYDNRDTSAFLNGTVQLSETNGWTAGALNSQKTITFSTAWLDVPTVVVWISGISASGDKPLCIKARASDVSRTGFKLHIDTESNCATLGGTTKATWIAYSGETTPFKNWSAHISNRASSGVLVSTATSHFTEMNVSLTLSNNTYPHYRMPIAFSAIKTRNSILQGLSMKVEMRSVPGKVGDKLRCEVTSFGNTQLESYELSYIARHWPFIM